MKIQTAFRLDESLLKKLKAEAKNEQRSLNNYVEYLLTQWVDNQPNQTTISAIHEAIDSGELEKIEDVDAFLKTL